MKAQYEALERQKAEYAEKVHGLKSYIRELTETAARNGTDGTLLEQDLMKAQSDAEFYENEIKLIGETMEGEAGRATYWVYQDAAGEWRWRLESANKRVIADSGEGYRHRQDCLHAVELVKDSKDAPVKEKG
jgi:uncharacterized protein YegP (UPF0339 family)